MFHDQELPIGPHVSLGCREMALLRLLASQPELRPLYWKKFWGVDLPYDSLDASLKDLVPTVVAMLEEDRGQGVWSVVPVTEVALLKGFCRHSWARNCIVRKNINLLMRLFADKGIDFIFLNNSADFVVQDSHSRARVVHQIEILINPHQRTRAKSVLQSSGLQHRERSRRAVIKNLFREPSTMRFIHPEWICELIVYSELPWDMPNQSRKPSTQGVWSRKVRIEAGLSSFVPHISDRLVMLAAELIKRSHKNQYGVGRCLADAVLILKSMDQDQVRTAFNISKECWGDVLRLEVLFAAFETINDPEVELMVKLQGRY